ncbi:MAG TPA: PIN domain-containing protein [Longimicrobiaceae bacterium]|nr:PIN domain-containing protein [Longimicrobiaceae bacterium]
MTGPAGAAGDRLRVCLDLNVYVAAEIALAKGRHDTTPLRLLDACRHGRFDLVVSHGMLERLTSVLRRPPLNLTLALATERAQLVGELAALPNLLVLGGGVMPLRDVEDRGVLEAALAGRAGWLATYNLADFSGIAEPDPETGFLRVRGVLIVHPADFAQTMGL